jgi:hypothetical protein
MHRLRPLLGLLLLGFPTFSFCGFDGGFLFQPRLERSGVLVVVVVAVCRGRPRSELRLFRGLEALELGFRRFRFSLLLAESLAQLAEGA